MLLSAGVGRDAAEIRQAQAAGDIADVAGSLAESRFRRMTRQLELKLEKRLHMACTRLKPLLIRSLPKPPLAAQNLLMPV